ncbi:MAG: hypothetical protein EBS85_05745 [Micrococcales bacterium]|nr:hypothetical protein [Actinomycetota bacterium]NCA08210.1 hypothetical protein [Micrococcales bacterium]
MNEQNSDSGVTTLKRSSIEHLDFNISCDYRDCEDKATHRLICPNCSHFEFMCDPHTRAAISAPKGSWIVFDKSCKHRVDMHDCGKEPI